MSLDNLSVFVLFFGILICLFVLIVYLFMSYKKLLKDIQKKNQEQEDSKHLIAMSKELIEQLEYEIAQKMESKSMQEYFFENSLNGILLIQEEDLKVIKCNQTAIDVLQNDISGKNLLDLPMENSYKKMLLENAMRIKRENKHCSFKMEILSPTRKIPVVVSMHIFEFGANKTLLFTFTDITEILELEQDLQKKRTMLIQKSKAEDMGKMLGNISHQWKQPLNSLYLIAQNLKDLGDDVSFDKEKFHHYLEMMRGQITFMSKTMDEFRNFYLPTKLKGAFNVADTILGILDLFYRLEGKKISIEFLKTESNKEISIFGIRNEFQQIMMVLIDNAIDSINENLSKNLIKSGKIKITCNKEMLDNKEFCVITIKDNGLGIQGESQDIFENYFTTKDNGSGIGLGVVRLILEEMQGKISFENLKDCGAKFIVMIPTLAQQE